MTTLYHHSEKPKYKQKYKDKTIRGTLATFVLLGSLFLVMGCQNPSGGAPKQVTGTGLPGGLSLVVKGEDSGDSMYVDWNILGPFRSSLKGAKFSLRYGEKPSVYTGTSIGDLCRNGGAPCYCGRFCGSQYYIYGSGRTEVGKPNSLNTYYFKGVVEFADGNSLTTEERSLTASPPPVIHSVSPGDGKVGLAWTPTENAMGYLILYSMNDDYYPYSFPFGAIGGLNLAKEQTSVEVTGLTNPRDTQSSKTSYYQFGVYAVMSGDGAKPWKGIGLRWSGYKAAANPE